MANDLIRESAALWTQGCDAKTARIVIFERVRDMAYAYPGSCDPLEVLQKSQGSCSGKHYLLAAMFACLGLKVRHMICTHRFNEWPITFPDQMQSLLLKNEIVDLHHYLQLAVDGDWIDVDATWEGALHDFGFPVNQDWDGESPMLIGVTPEDTQIAERDPEKLKEEMLSHLTPRQRSLRKQFLESLSAWVQDLAAESRRDAESG